MANRFGLCCSYLVVAIHSSTVTSDAQGTLTGKLMVNVFFVVLKSVEESESILGRTPLHGCAGLDNAEVGQLQRRRAKSIPYQDLDLLLLTDFTVLSELSMFVQYSCLKV